MKQCNFDWAVFCNGPSWNNTAADFILLEETTKNCLISAQENGIKSIAFPAIGNGGYFYIRVLLHMQEINSFRGNFPKQSAIATILCAMSIYLNSEKHNLTHVTFVLHDPESIQIYVSELARLEE
jgi:O-acetyl-ADP-ribose deacetylase (regulator of RNase III)